MNIIDWSLELPTQFLTQQNVKAEASKIGESSNKKNNRAKTPAYENYNTQIAGENAKLSPQGILKKPHTAKVGVRKQVHYNNVEFTTDFTTYNKAIGSPKMQNIFESSYFKK